MSPEISLTEISQGKRKDVGVIEVTPVVLEKVEQIWRFINQRDSVNMAQAILELKGMVPEDEYATLIRGCVHPFAYDAFDRVWSGARSGRASGEEFEKAHDCLNEATYPLFSLGRG